MYLKLLPSSKNTRLESFQCTSPVFVLEEAVVVVGANISFMNDMWAGVGPRIELETNIREF